MLRARELRKAGWFIDDIIDRLELEQGVRPNRDTVSIWTNPARAESHGRATLASQRRIRSARRSGRLGQARHTPEFQEVRARLLAATGMTQLNVARALDFDYPGQGWTYHRVQALLGPARAKAAA